MTSSARVRSSVRTGLMAAPMVAWVPISDSVAIRTCGNADRLTSSLPVNIQPVFSAAHVGDMGDDRSGGARRCWWWDRLWSAGGWGRPLLPTAMVDARLKTHKIEGAGDCGLGIIGFTSLWYGHSGQESDVYCNTKTRRSRTSWSRSRVSLVRPVRFRPEAAAVVVPLPRCE
jgi:hypothetical protein